MGGRGNQGHLNSRFGELALMCAVSSSVQSCCFMSCIVELLETKASLYSGDMLIEKRAAKIEPAGLSFGYRKIFIPRA